MFRALEVNGREVVVPTNTFFATAAAVAHAGGIPRLADVSSPLSAPKNARRARHNLEEAVKRDPQNHEYLLELFDFCLDSPEWFHGGLQQAATLLELIRSAESDPEPWLKEIADSRREHSGPGWCMRRAVLWTSGAIGHIIPGP